MFRCAGYIRSHDNPTRSVLFQLTSPTGTLDMFDPRTIYLPTDQRPRASAWHASRPLTRHVDVDTLAGLQDA